MKLLLDENISRRIIPFILQESPGSTQISLLNKEQSSDTEIWGFAKLNGYIIVMKYADFYDMSVLYGQPPKVIWLKIGSQNKAAVINALPSSRSELEKLFIVEDKACVE